MHNCDPVVSQSSKQLCAQCTSEIDDQPVVCPCKLVPSTQYEFCSEACCKLHDHTCKAAKLCQQCKSPLTPRTELTCDCKQVQLYVVPVLLAVLL